MAAGSTYSSGDFAKMQDDAVRRAREMSMRSTPPENAPRHCPKCGRTLTADGRHTGRLPSEKSSRPETAERPARSSASTRQRTNEPPRKFTPPASQKSSAHSSAAPQSTAARSPLFQLFGSSGSDSSESAPKINIPFLGDINIDRDFIIIGGVLLTLLGEETDRFLLMALVYIML